MDGRRDLGAIYMEIVTEEHDGTVWREKQGPSIKHRRAFTITMWMK